jgi:phosphohistidine phosphatase SixA
LVGHEPMMSNIVRNFTDKKDPEFAFKKAGVCYINMDLDKGHGKFEWYLNPKTTEYQK